MLITSSQSGSEVASTINQALEDAGSSVAISNESGSSASGKLNEVFGDNVLDDTQSGSEWAQAVEDGFDGVQPSEPDNAVKFLHISDLHGYADALEVCKNMMANDDSIAFTMITGDVSQYGTNALSSAIVTQMASIPDGKLLICAGNHDTYDMTYGVGHGQQQTTNYIKTYCSGVVYGDLSGVASYWHKDIQLSASSKLRIIALDQYETAVMGRANNKYYTMYSQAQVNWLIGLLKALDETDYVIIAMHEPAVQNQSRPDAYAQDMSVISGNPQKLFMTSGLYSFGNRGDEPNLNLLPRIMRAYMHKEHLSVSYNNMGGNSNNPDITIDETFSGNPATFLFWMGGHQHGDIGYYIPDESGAAKDGGDFSDQLLMCITAASRSIRYAYYDDLGGVESELPTPINPSTETYRINEYEIDFDSKTIAVTRHGDKNTYDGRVRSSVTFPFEKEGGES